MFLLFSSQMLSLFYHILVLFCSGRFLWVWDYNVFIPLSGWTDAHTKSRLIWNFRSISALEQNLSLLSKPLLPLCACVWIWGFSVFYYPDAHLLRKFSFRLFRCMHMCVHILFSLRTIPVLFFFSSLLHNRQYNKGFSLYP